MPVGLPRVPGYPSGTPVINYPGNFFTVICYTNKCIINERYIPEHQNKLNIYDLQNYDFLQIFLNRKNS